MTDYIDLVLVSYITNGTVGNAEYLYCAPFNSGISAGNMVLVESSASNLALAKVNKVYSCRKDSEEYSFILSVTGGKNVRRVNSLTVPLDYSDEDYFTGIE